MADIIRNLFNNWLYLPFLSLLAFLESDIVWFYVLIVIFIVSISIKSGIDKRNLTKGKDNNQNPDENKKQVQAKKRNELLPRVVNTISIITIILLLIVGYARFGTQIKDFFKTDTTTTPTNTTTTPGSTSTPAQQTTPTYQAPKQLYYSIGCYNCWADGCPRDGYSYNGYDSASYTYYDNACHICDCSSINGRSFWK